MFVFLLLFMSGNMSEDQLEHRIILWCENTDIDSNEMELEDLLKTTDYIEHIKILM